MRSLIRSARRASAISIIVAAHVAAQAAAPARPVPAAAAAWWRHVTVLADDSMRGREAGSSYYLTAARYVAGEFAKVGLAPAGTDGFFQTAHLTTVRLVPEHSGIALVHGSVADTLVMGTDATIQLSTTTAAATNAPMVFVGFGMHFPNSHDDLAGVDIRGKVAVYVAGLPPGLSATLLAHARSSRWNALRAAGAVGAVVITEPPAAGRGGAGRGGAGGGRGTSGLADDPTGGGVQINVPATSSAAEKLFAGSGTTLKAILDLVAAAKPLPTLPLAPSLNVWTELTRTPLDAPNVLGVLRGSDPKLRDEYLIVSAHLDHLAVGRPVDGDSIYNGAMDNASGVATLIETARTFHDRGIRPRRSIIFAAVTAEEKGELGSGYFATHPTVPLQQIVADLNTDMWLPLIPLTGIFAYGADESTLGDDVRAVLKARGLALMEDPEPEQVRFIRSDQYSFIKRGIPAMAFKNGYTKDSPQMATISEWLKVRYHKPSDDLNQPVDFQSVIDFDAMYFDIVHAVADRPARPAWLPASVFNVPR